MTCKSIFRAKGTHSQSGFSLVELMIVVGIIGILATLAVPKFKKFQGKARAAEAQNMLSHIYALQETYYVDNDAYAAFPKAGYGNTGNCSHADLKALGLELIPCNATTPRYSYISTGGATFTATAESGAGTNNLVCPGKSAHSHTIDQDRNLRFYLGTTAVSTGFRCE